MNNIASVTLYKVVTLSTTYIYVLSECENLEKGEIIRESVFQVLVCFQMNRRPPFIVIDYDLENKESFVGS